MALRPVDPSLVVRGTDDDPRLGRCVVPEGPADVVLVGCADDTGVANSGGRTGAAQGPTEIRRWLYKQTTGMDEELAGLRLRDMGDVLPGASLEETHAEVEHLVAEAVATGAAVVFLGGGHDLAYASQSGLFARTEGPVAVVNVDTHLDVRPLKEGRIVTSGTPFRRLLERWGERVHAFVELGIQPQHNARAHAEWVRQHKGRIVTLAELRQAPGAAERMKRELGAAAGAARTATVSIDLDVVAAGVGPGVSAPPADGLAAEELVRFADAAGRHPKVRLLDVVEHAPAFDENAKTARLAALCVWHFLVGVLAR